MSVALPLFGHALAERRFVEAFHSGRLHHAWLIEGPEGIGKARLATRLAAFLLGARGPNAAPVDFDADDPVWRAFAAGSHPDAQHLKRMPNDKGKLAQDITVDQVRSLTQFFTKKPALGGWRVGIIDAIDETNRNGANALLKTLEEPPAHSVLFLIHHGRLPLLPTVRSRCRVLRLSPLTAQDCQRALGAAGAPEGAARIAQGRPGRGIRLSTPAALAASDAARALLRALPNLPDKFTLPALSAAATDEAALEAFQAEILDWLADRAEADPVMARLWLKLARLAGESGHLNMDTAQVAAKLMAGLYEAAQAV